MNRIAGLDVTQEGSVFVLSLRDKAGFIAMKAMIATRLKVERSTIIPRQTCSIAYSDEVISVVTYKSITMIMMIKMTMTMDNDGDDIDVDDVDDGDGLQL